MKEFRHDVNQFVDYDSMFHMQVAVATHNKLLMSTMMASKDSFENGIRLAMRESLTQNPRVIDVTIELHGKIIEAIKSGDYQTAYTAMREHIFLCEPDGEVWLMEKDPKRVFFCGEK